MRHASASRDPAAMDETAMKDVARALDALTLGTQDDVDGPRLAAMRPRYGRILLAYDGSDGARLALDHARDLARLHEGRVLVASVHAPPQLNSAAAMAYGLYPEYVDEFTRLEEAAHRWAVHGTAELDAAGVEAEPAAEGGTPARKLVQLADVHRVDLLVAGATRHGPVGQLLLGSTVMSVLDHAPCSVLVARQPAPPRRILAATDGSMASHRAIAHALDLARRADADLLVQHVLAYPEEPEKLRAESLLRKVVARAGLPAGPPRVRYALDAGDPSLRILQRAKDEACDLLVVGAHGMGRAERFLLGSVSRRVTSHAHASVLVVKEPAWGDVGAGG